MPRDLYGTFMATIFPLLASFICRSAGRSSVGRWAGGSVSRHSLPTSLPPSLPPSFPPTVPLFRPSVLPPVIRQSIGVLPPFVLSLSGANTHPLWPSSRPTERCAEEEDMRTTDRGPPRSGRARLARADRRRAGGGSRTWTDRSRRYDILGMKVDQPSPSLSLPSFPSFPAL